MTLSSSETTENYKAEDTDGPEKQEHEEEMTSVWCRIAFGVTLVIAVTLIVYGLFIEKPAPARHKAISELPLKGTELTFKPKDEVRTFEFATLRNGMQAVTVRDSRALQQGFAVAVRAGSFDDPDRLPGLAHFCEHMVFLGTEQFKEPSSFDNFIAANGGFNNALTSEEATVYYASVRQTAAAEGLDRFADFFRAPLFDGTYADKELHAIDNEHSKNLHNQYRPVLAVMYSLADPKNPTSRFHTGNLETLQAEPAKMQPPVDPVHALKMWFETHYCPDRMNVVTVGSASNEDQLKQIEKRFGDLQPKSSACEAPVEKHNEPIPFPPERLQKFVVVQGMTPRSYLWVQFSLPDVRSKYASAPLDYLHYVLTYSGEGSLTRVLKDTFDLADGIEVLFDGSSAATEVFIVVQLTQRGRLHEQLVLDVIFAYLAVLNRDGVQEDLYNSLAAVKKLGWDWHGHNTPAETSRDLAERLTRVKPADLLWAESLILQPDIKLVQSLLAKLNPKNMNVAFVRAASKSPSGMDPFLKDRELNFKTLPRWGMKYAVKDIDPHQIEKWDQWLRGDVTATSVEKSISRSVASLQLKDAPHEAPMPKGPSPIQGIPRSLNVEHMHAESVLFSSKVPIDTLVYGPAPQALQLQPAAASGRSPEIWFRAGWMGHSPKVRLSLSLNTLKTTGEPELRDVDVLQLELYGRLLAEEMSPKLVDLTVTGMSYTIGVGSGGLDFKFVGFEPSMNTLIRKVMSEFNAFNRNPTITSQVRWSRVVNALHEDLTTYSDIPLNYAVADRNLLLTKGSLHRTELVHALEAGIPDLMKSSSTSVSKLLLSRPARLTALAMGNTAKTQATAMIDEFLQSVEYPGGVAPGPPAAEADVERSKPVLNIQKSVEVRKLNPRHGDDNNVIIVSIVAGVSTVESRVLFGLLSSLWRPIAYNELRTEQQIGYIVNAGVVLISNVHLMSCMVQGNRIDADAMEAAVHRVSMDLMAKRLERLTPEELAAYKDSFRQELLQPPMTLDDEFEHFQGPVNQGGIGFGLVNEMLRFLDGPLVTKETLTSQWQNLMSPKTGERNKVVVKYFASEQAMHPRSLEQVKKTWLAHNLTKESMLLLEREFNSTKLLTKVDSAERDRLAKEVGWFPTKQHLLLKDPEKSTSSKPLEVPEQLQEISKERQREIATFKGTPVRYEEQDVLESLRHRLISSPLMPRKTHNLRSSVLAADV